MKTSMIVIGLVLALTGCYLLDAKPQQLPPEFTPEVPALSTHSPDLGAWQDALGVMGGICFEAAADAAGQVFVLRDAAELSRFFDLADHSNLCRRPVQRELFDFSGGRILAGFWDDGIGCTARHEVIDSHHDTVTNTLTLTLQLVIEGDCPYELVRPFWVGGTYADIQFIHQTPAN